MAITSEKRLLTNPVSKIAKADPTDLTKSLSHPAAWHTLPLAVRTHLYTLLPAPQAGEPAHDADVHPMETVLRVHIETALLRWQKDLGEGREETKWRETAVKVGRERGEGKWGNGNGSKGNGEAREGKRGGEEAKVVQDDGEKGEDDGDES